MKSISQAIEEGKAEQKRKERSMETLCTECQKFDARPAILTVCKKCKKSGDVDPNTIEYCTACATDMQICRSCGSGLNPTILIT